MSIVNVITNRVGRALRPVRAGDDKLAYRRLGIENASNLIVSSAAFSDAEALPCAATSDGEGLPPQIAWRGVPVEARSIVVVCEDPDAPLPKAFVHWLVYDLPARDGALDEATLAAAKQGKNTKGGTGYSPAAPPPGHGVHHYHFQVFALDRALELGSHAGRSELLAAMRGHIAAFGELVGTYSR